MLIHAWKVKIETKLDNRGYSEYSREKFDDMFDKDAIYDLDELEDTKLKNLGEISIGNASSIFKLAKTAMRFDNEIKMEELFCYYLDIKKIEYEFIHESQEEELEKYKDYHTVDYY